MTTSTYLGPCSKQEVSITLLLHVFLRGHVESGGANIGLYLLIDCGRIYVQQITSKSSRAARSPLSDRSFSPVRSLVPADDQRILRRSFSISHCAECP